MKGLLPLFLLISCIAGVVYAQPELDVTFNGNGRVTTDFTANIDAPYKLLVQPDGKIVAVGHANTNASPQYFALSRYNDDGSLDSSFGDNGKVLTDFDPAATNEGAQAAALQPDGKIIVAGFSSIISPGEGYFALIRYNPNGSIDTAFGDNGRVRLAVRPHMHYARAITLAPDGKIIVAGDYFSASFTTETLVYRLHTDGSVDSAFGSQGRYVSSQGSTMGDANIPKAIAIMPDGGVVIVGTFNKNLGATDPIIMRLTADGLPFPGFGNQGRLQLSTPGISDSFNGVTVTPNGRIVAVGMYEFRFYVVRMFDNGMLDISFSDDGRVTTPTMIGTANSVFVRPGGKLFVTGTGYDGSITSFGAAAYDFNGSLDTSYSGDGQLVFNFNSTRTDATCAAADGLGRILIAGINDHNYFALARLYTPDPAPVTVSGWAVTPSGNPIRGIYVELTDPAGQTRYALTSSLGYFQLNNILTGRTYNLSVSSKKYLVQSRDIGVNSAIDNLEVVGVPNESTKNLRVDK